MVFGLTAFDGVVCGCACRPLPRMDFECAGGGKWSRCLNQCVFLSWAFGFGADAD